MSFLISNDIKLMESNNSNLISQPFVLNASSPSSVFNSNSVGEITPATTFKVSGAMGLQSDAYNVNIAPANAPINMSGVALPGGDVSKVVQTTPSDQSSPTWGTMFKNVLSTGLNLGANVLMQKAGISSNATTTSPANLNSEKKEGSRPVIIYDPSASGGENINNVQGFLNNLLGGLLTKNSGSTVQSSSMNTYLIIGVVILIVFLLVGRK